jgi:hypothetical protein
MRLPGAQSSDQGGLTSAESNVHDGTGGLEALKFTTRDLLHIPDMHGSILAPGGDACPVTTQGGREETGAMFNHTQFLK